MSLLDQLKQYSTIVADTGDIEAIRKFKPQDATTNPSLLLKAAQLPQYAHNIKKATDFASRHSNYDNEYKNLAVDKFAVDIGSEILQIIPGRVSTEIDASLSFDSKSTIQRAQFIIDLYAENNIDKDRVLIKIASTWEGIRAAEQLEKQGIHCNLTLLFGLNQAIACADAGVTLISPFVGRVLDWYNKNTGKKFTAINDPGVLSVKEIYNYYKSHDYTTTILAASFRNIGEICELSGCDLLTISPSLLEELANQGGQLSRKLDPNSFTPINKQVIDEKTFRWKLNDDAMACEKLAEGIRSFDADLDQLKRKMLSFY